MAQSIEKPRQRSILTQAILAQHNFGPWNQHPVSCQQTWGFMALSGSAPWQEPWDCIVSKCPVAACIAILSVVWPTSAKRTLNACLPTHGIALQASGGASLFETYSMNRARGSDQKGWTGMSPLLGHTISLDCSDVVMAPSQKPSRPGRHGATRLCVIPVGGEEFRCGPCALPASTDPPRCGSAKNALNGLSEKCALNGAMPIYCVTGTSARPISPWELDSMIIEALEFGRSRTVWPQY